MNTTFENVAGITTVIICVILVIWVIWHAYFEPWTCLKCGKKYRGHICEDGREYGDVGPCCLWRKITHAEYNRSFGIEPKLRRVK